MGHNRTPSGRLARTANAGFTLVEVVAAVAILGGVIVGLLVARGSAMNAHMGSAEMLTCARLCASQAAALRAGVAFPGRGRFSEPAEYEWRIRGPLAPDPKLPRLAGYEVTVYPPSGDENIAATLTVWLRTGGPPS